MHRSALVLFSGGQDSTTRLAWSLARHPRVETSGFDYGRQVALGLGLDRRDCIVFEETHPCYEAWKRA